MCLCQGQPAVPLENVDEATLPPAGGPTPSGLTVTVPEECVDAVPSDGASLLPVGTSSTGQMMNHLLPVCRTTKEEGERVETRVEVRLGGFLCILV